MSIVPQKIHVATTNFNHVEVISLTRINDFRSSTKAVARIKIGVLAIDGIKIILLPLASRPFVSMPSRKVGDQWAPVVSILSPTLEQAVTDAVLDAWRNDGAR